MLFTAIYGSPLAMFGSVEYGEVESASAYSSLAAVIDGSSDVTVDVINYAKKQCPVVTPQDVRARLLAVDIPIAIVIRTYVGSVAELEVECE